MADHRADRVNQLIDSVNYTGVRPAADASRSADSNA
jgi:hypothetical protein